MASGKHDFVTLISEYSINYRDISDEIRFRVLLRSNLILGIERWYLQVYKEKDAIFTHFLKEGSVELQYDCMLRKLQLDCQDMSFVDKLIKKIIVGRHDFGNGYGISWFYEYE